MLHLYPDNRAALPRFKPARAVLMAVLFAFLMGCGADASPVDHGNDNSSANNTVDENGADAGDLTDTSTGGANPDAGDEYDASESADASDEFDDESSYDEDLHPPEAPLGDCLTEHVGPDAPGRLGARIFIPSYRLDFDALASHQSYREHIHQLVRAQVVPCMPANAATLVVFPEAMSLPMLLIGRKAAAARQMQDSSSALSAMIAQVPEANAYYAEKYPTISANSRFMLAMTDPLVRATYDTFGQLAAHYGLYISVSVTLPEFSRVQDPAEVRRLADPDITHPGYAYRAEGAEIYSRQLLFGPDGEVRDETLKTYLSQMGREELGLNDAPLRTLHTFESPWGSSAVTQSDTALMPDVQDRLDDLGARVILQPNALPGGWADGTIWQPDRFMLGSYNLVQRSPRIARSYVPQLTGNFFEILFDAQIQMVADAHAHPESHAFIGQQNPAPGTIFIGPWVVEDPQIAHPEWSLDARRAQLQETGARMAPDASVPLDGGAVQGVWSNDLPAPELVAAIETHPALLATPEHLYLATSQGEVGARGLRMQVFSPDQDAPQLLAEAQVSLPGYDLIRPTIAAGDSQIHIVAELLSGAQNRLAYFTYHIPTRRFVGEPLIIDTQFVGAHAYHPAIAVSGDVLNMTWVQEINGVNRAFFAQTSLGAPFENLSVRTEIARRADETMAYPDSVHSDAERQAPASQWDARLAVTPSAIAVIWMNYRAPNWEVLAAASVDGGLSWSRALRVDTVPEHVQALNASPTIEAIEGRRFAIAWTDARATRPETRIGLAMLTVASNGAVSMATPARLIDMDAQDDVSQEDAAGQTRWSWRPSLAADAQGFSVYYESLNGAQRSIWHTRLDVEGRLIRSESLGDSASGYFPSAASTHRGAFLAFEALGAPTTPHASTAQLIRSTVESPAN